MSAELLTEGPLQARFFALAETITTDILGPDYAVRVDEHPGQVAARVGMRAPVRMPDPAELEISALYRGARGIQNIEIVTFTDHAEGTELVVGRNQAVSSFEGEWYEYILAGLLRYMCRKEVVAVYPRLVPVLPVVPEQKKADIKVTYFNPRLAHQHGAEK